MDEYEVEVRRHERRQSVFMNEGLSEDKAFALAEQMFMRDRDPSDDRRVCFECSHYARVCKAIKVAGKQLEPLRFILQRCPDFNLKGAK